MPTNQDDDHAKYLSLKGARVGVGWKRMLGVFLRIDISRNLSVGGLYADTLPIAIEAMGVEASNRDRPLVHVRPWDRD
jgi:hypothetical protein